MYICLLQCVIFPLLRFSYISYFVITDDPLEKFIMQVGTYIFINVANFIYRAVKYSYLYKISILHKLMTEQRYINRRFFL